MTEEMTLLCQGLRESVVFKGTKVSEVPPGVDWMQTGAINQAERPA